MALEDLFEIPKETRTAFIKEDIVAKLPVNTQEDAEKRTTAIVNNYVALDLDALSVLAYAAQQGKFQEFAEKLEKHYNDNVTYLHPDSRRIPLVPGAVRAKNFFLKCYNELGVKPKEE